MRFSQQFWRGLVFLLLIAALCGGMVLPVSGISVSAAPFMQVAALTIIINEIGWSGTQASANAEWIELYNPGLTDIILTGWTLRATDGTPNIPLSGTIVAGGYYLLERTNDNAVSDIAADLIYTGAMSNTVEVFELRDNTNAIVDTANQGGANWFAGNATGFYSMERISVVADSSTAWASNNGAVRNGIDANSNSINGTPRQQNSATLALTATVTPTITNTPTITSTPTQTFTPTITSTPTMTLTPVAVMRVIISEVAWMGTQASGNEEWIELYNPSSQDVDLSNWRIVATDGIPSITIPSGKVIRAGGFFLLEASDNAVIDAVADHVYGGSNLSDSGESLLLLSPLSVTPVDTANSNGGIWPAGNSTFDNSMERVITAGSPRPDSDNAWISNVLSSTWTKHDSRGTNSTNFLIRGTPGYGNWAFTVTPTIAVPTQTRTATPRPSPTRTATFPPPPPLVAINEFVPRPGHDWNNDGVVNVQDEYVELINHGVIDVNLGGYILDDEVNIGSSPYNLPAITISPGERIVFYGSETNLLLSDGGDGVRLLKPNGQLGDAYNYRVVRFPDQSFCRLPDNGGLDDWNTNCFPTPGLQNALSGSSVSPPNVGSAEDLCPIADTLPIDFILAECPPFGNNIWRSAYWDEPGWYGEQYLPESPGKWPVFAD